MAWPTLPAAWDPLNEVDASDINLFLDAWAHLAADWDTDTPALTADTSNPTGVPTWAYYKKTGDVFQVQQGFYGDAGASAGTGDYRLALANSQTVTGVLADQTLVGGAWRSNTGMGRVFTRMVTSDDFEMEGYHDGVGRMVIDHSPDFVIASTRYVTVAGLIEVD